MSQAIAGKPIEILLVEDNPGDVRLTEEVLREHKVQNRIHTVDNGVEAMAFLRKEGKYAMAPRPGLVLLDLNLPKKDGREVLSEIKGDAKLKSLPVVILTTSQSEEDVLRAYGLQADCYITKPLDLEQLAAIVRSVENFWFTLVTTQVDQAIAERG